MTSLSNQPIKELSPEGEALLKTATAAPDFEQAELEGIPDNYNGPTVVKKDYIFQTVVAAAGHATYFIVPPTAGTSHYRMGYTPGIENLNPLTGNPLTDGDIFIGQNYPDSAQIFPGAESLSEVNNSAQLSKGRLMALSAELNCVTNSFNQYGTISCWKTPLARTTAPYDQVGVDVSDNLLITGGQGLVKVALGSQAYVAPVREGAYSVSMNREQDFSFYPVLDELFKSSETKAIIEAGDNLTFIGCSPVFDNGFDSIIFRIDVPPGTQDQSFVLKIWKVWEYQPTFNSLLYNFAHLSPNVDESSLALYRAMCRELPTAVSDKQNPDFWDAVLAGVQESSNLLGGMPGFAGLAGKGVHAITNLVRQRRSRRRAKKAPKKPQPPRPRARRPIASTRGSNHRRRR